MSLGHPFFGSFKPSVNRFVKDVGCTTKPTHSNGIFGRRSNGKPNGYHPYSLSEPRVRRKNASRLFKGYEFNSPTLPPPTNLAEGDPGVAADHEGFTFTPDYNYFRFFELEEHKGRGEGSATTSFSQPQFSTVRSVELRQHTESVRTVAWNTTGQYFATGSVDRTVAIWEIDNMNNIRLHKELRAHTGSIDQLCWDPKTPNRIATASSDKTVRVWNAQSGELLHLISTPGENINICWSPDGKYLAVGNKTMTISFIDVEKSQIVNEHTHSVAINEITWNHSGAFFLLSTSQGNVTMLDFPNLNHVFTLPSHTASCYCLDIDPYGRFLATGGADGKVSVWCLKTLACLVTYNQLSSPVRALSFSFDGQFLACASENDFIDICDSQTGNTIHQVECTKPVNSIAWHPSRHLLGFSADVVRSEDEAFRSSLPQNQVKVFGI